MEITFAGFHLKLANNDSKIDNSNDPKESYIIRKWKKLKKWYVNKKNPNQWVLDILKEKRKEYMTQYHIKYNYHTIINYEEALESLVYDLNHQMDCIQFIQMISKTPQRFSIGVQSSSSVSSSSSSSSIDSLNDLTYLHRKSQILDNDHKLQGSEIDLEIMIVEYMVLKEHLGNFMKYLQDRHISLTTSITIPGTPRISRPHPPTFYIVDTADH
jgi:hypothetical protein